MVDNTRTIERFGLFGHTIYELYIQPLCKPSLLNKLRSMKYANGK